MNKNLKLLRSFIFFIIKFTIIYFIFIPLSKLVPKNKKMFIFISKQQWGGKFSDNIKYLFLYLNELKENNIRYYYLTENKITFNDLKKQELPVLYYPSIKSILYLFRTGHVVVDSTCWISKLKYFILLNSKKIQLWHGIALKKVGRSNIKNKNKYDEDTRSTTFKIANNYKMHKYNQTYPNYDIFLSTSEFITKNVFEPSFIYKNLIECGYPRNDVFFHDNKHYLLGCDIECINWVIKCKKDGFKTILYSPTYRDTGGNSIEQNVLNIEKFDDFLKKNKFKLIIKFHPNESFDLKSLENTSNIYIYESKKDLNPLLPKIDLLLTDYSSIYFDFLYAKRPIVFFPYDLNKYQAKDREFYFDYNEITPGPKCINQQQLEESIYKILAEKKDLYKKERSKILKLGFKYEKGPFSKIIWEYIKQNS
ncbi:MAG: CDP-glycerol glycerophosphotransferase family protein [Pseudomonadota bacterium]